MDVRYINPFIFGIQKVFSTMLDTRILISKPCVKVSEGAHADVLAIIGFSGGAAGNVTLCFPLRTAVSVASKFSGTEITAEHPDFGDALGGLANMVAGHAKSKFDGLDVSISLPRVISGQEIKLLDSKTSPVLILPCDSRLGRFTTEVSMVVTRKSAAACA